MINLIFPDFRLNDSYKNYIHTFDIVCAIYLLTSYIKYITSMNRSYLKKRKVREENMSNLNSVVQAKTLE